jgi:hypothetical protein
MGGGNMSMKIDNNTLKIVLLIFMALILTLCLFVSVYDYLNKYPHQTPKLTTNNT